MRMTDYLALAKAIRENTKSFVVAGDFVVWASSNLTIDKDKFLDALCDILAADNPRFDKQKFMEACK